MSHFETAEQRQIRQLRNTINTLTNSLNDLKRGNSTADKQRAQQILQLRQEIERLTQQHNQQVQQMEANFQRRLQEAVATEHAAMTANLQALDRELREQERLQNEKLRNMRQQHDNQIRQMNESFRAENQVLRQEIHQTRSEMQQNMAQLRTETDEKLRLQRVETQQAITAMGTKLEGQIQNVNQRVNSLAQLIMERDQNKRELAEYWAQEAERLLRQLTDTFRPQLFDARRLARLRQQLSHARDDIRSGLFESAVSNGREAFYDALDMKEDLTAAELEWSYWFNAVHTRQVQLLENLDIAQRRIYTMELDGETVVDDNGIDYWTNGQLSIVTRRAEAQRRNLESLEQMDLSQLQQQEEQLRGLLEELALIENTAHINVAMSLSRYETAALIGQILGENYRMVDSDGDFFSEENRDEYHAIFQNPMTSDRVAVVITPIPDEAGIVTNHIELIVGSADNDPLTRVDMANTVAAQMRSAGVEGCKFPCVQRHGSGTVQEVDRVGDIAAVAAGDVKTRATIPQHTTSENPSAAARRRVDQKIRG